MTKAQLQKMIERASQNGYGDWHNEWAIKTYIYPLAGALTTTDEWEKITEGGDGSTIMGVANVNWLVATMRERLHSLVLEMGLPEKWDDEFYLDVCSGGLVYNDKGKIKSVSFNFNVRPDGCDVFRNRGWKPLKTGEAE